MSDKPEINIRAEVLQDKLFLLPPEKLKEQSLDDLEALVKYWELWIEAVAGKQIFNLLEAKALAEELIAKKRQELQEYKEYLRMKKLATPPVLDN